MIEIRHGPVRVTLSANRAVEEWIRARTRSFFELVPISGTSGELWTVAAGRRVAPQARDYEVHEIVSDMGERVRYLFSRRQKALVVDLPAGPWRNIFTLRAVRHLLRWQLQSHGALFLHGVAMALRDEVVFILGSPGSGKSVLSLLLVHRGWNWVSQDDLCLLPVDGQWLALGWPGSVRLRRSAEAVFPALFSRRRFLHPGNAVEAPWEGEAARLRLLADEVQRMTGATILGRGRLRAIFLLDGSLGAEGCEALPPTALLDALRAAWDVLPERKAGSRLDPLHRGGWSETVFNPFLFEAFGHPELPLLEGRLAELSRSVPAWRMGRTFLMHLDT